MHYWSWTALLQVRFIRIGFESLALCQQIHTRVICLLPANQGSSQLYSPEVLVK